MGLAGLNIYHVVHEQLFREGGFVRWTLMKAIVQPGVTLGVNPQGDGIESFAGHWQLEHPAIAQGIDSPAFHRGAFREDAGSGDAGFGRDVSIHSERKRVNMMVGKKQIALDGPDRIARDEQPWIALQSSGVTRSHVGHGVVTVWSP